MATALDYNLSRSTYDKNDNYICDCGQKCTNKKELDQHKLDNCKIRSIPCTFCQEPQPSSSALRDHLMTCGNKTDQCPNCRKFIRRAVFAYHYENNCANLEETDTPTSRPRSSSGHRLSSKSNTPASRENDVNDDDQENNDAFDSSNYRTKGLERISSATSTKRRSLNMIECEFCNNRCELSDYQIHKESCLKNPNNLTKPRQQTSSISKNPESRPSTSERRRSPDIVYIPCEICNEQIDLQLWSTHVKDCQGREIRRIEARAETINREPVTEKIPCEHCKELLSAERLRTHEVICQKNPENIARATRLTNLSPLTTVGLSNKSSRTERDSTLSSTYSSLPLSSVSAYNRPSRSRDILDHISDREYTTTLQNERFLSHLTVDTKRGQDSVRSRDNDASALIISRYKSPKQRTTSHDLSSQLINSSHDVVTHDSFPLLSNDHFSSDTESLSRKLRSATSLDRTSFDRQSENRRPMPRREASPNISGLRSKSASRSSPDARGSHRTNATTAVNHLPVSDDVFFHSPRDEDHRHQPKLNQHDRPATSNNKSKVKTSFFNPIPWKH